MGNHIRDLDKDIQDAEELKAKYARLIDAVDQLLKALQEQKQGLESERQALAILGLPMPSVPALAVNGQSTSKTRRKRNYGKPNSQLYEDIIREHGKPMHMSDILEEALKRGLKLKGKRTPVVQMRSALANCQRLYNVGSNTWWVIDKPLPEELPVKNGDNKSVDMPTAHSTLTIGSPSPRLLPQ